MNKTSDIQYLAIFIYRGIFQVTRDLAHQQHSFSPTGTGDLSTTTAKSSNTTLTPFSQTASNATKDPLAMGSTACPPTYTLAVNCLYDNKIRQQYSTCLLLGQKPASYFQAASNCSRYKNQAYCSCLLLGQRPASYVKAAII